MPRGGCRHIWRQILFFIGKEETVIFPSFFYFLRHGRILFFKSQKPRIGGVDTPTHKCLFFAYCMFLDLTLQLTSINFGNPI